LAVSLALKHIPTITALLSSNAKQHCYWLYNHEVEFHIETFFFQISIIIVCRFRDSHAKAYAFQIIELNSKRPYEEAAKI